MNFLIGLLCVIFILVAIRPTEVISRWHHFLEESQFSPQDCYTIIQRCIEKRQIPYVRCFRMMFVVQGILTGRREYLRVTNGQYIFEICAAPYGTGFFISHWLRESKTLWQLVIQRIFPFAGNRTFYQIDTETMFRETVHRAIVEAVAEIASTKGLRGLTDLEKQLPINPKFMYRIKSIE